MAKAKTKTPPTGPWNKGKVVGRKPHLTPDQVTAIEYHLGHAGRTRDLALFRLAIDTMLRGVDLVQLQTVSVMPSGRVVERFGVGQQKTGKPLQVLLTDRTRKAVQAWYDEAGPKVWQFLFPGRHKSHMTETQYRNLVKQWVALAGLDPTLYGSHSLRRTKPRAIYAATGNLRAIQLLLGHSSITSTQVYLGIDEAEALEVAAEFAL